MTTTEINVAIADSIGATRGWWCPNCESWLAAQNATFDERHDDPDCDAKLQYAPNYCHDLNAMREATSTLMDGELIWFVDQLLCVIHEVDSGYFNRVEWALASDLITATAHQYAEAFLRVKNLWKD